MSVQENLKEEGGSMAISPDPTFLTCLREKQMNLGTESFHEDKISAQSLLFSAEAAGTAYRARMQEIKLLLEAFLSSVQGEKKYSQKVDND